MMFNANFQRQCDRKLAGNCRKQKNGHKRVGKVTNWDSLQICTYSFFLSLCLWKIFLLCRMYQRRRWERQTSQL